jgi:hypothetical protein
LFFFEISKKNGFLRILAGYLPLFACAAGGHVGSSDVGCLTKTLLCDFIKEPHEAAFFPGDEPHTSRPTAGFSDIGF